MLRNFVKSPVLDEAEEFYKCGIIQYAASQILNVSAADLISKALTETDEHLKKIPDEIYQIIAEYYVSDFQEVKQALNFFKMKKIRELCLRHTFEMNPFVLHENEAPQKEKKHVINLWVRQKEFHLT